MLRLTTALSIVPWASLLIGCTLALWFGFSDLAIYTAGLILNVTAVILSLTMLVRNQPFVLGLMFLISILGILPGLLGVAAIFRCIAAGFGSGSDGSAKAVDWLFAVSLTLMLVTPINWAILWRGYRHDAALNI
jgi:hypothetical protein